MGYSSLISYIQSRVYENDSQDISGTGLQEALLQMVASLGDGYQFKGVATPATNPGTPDQNVFYIASEVGTYSNFGLSVGENEVAVFLWNGSWSKQSTGAASAEAVNQLGQEVIIQDFLPESIDADTFFNSNAVSVGASYTNTQAALEGTYSTKIQVSANEKYKIVGEGNAYAVKTFFLTDSDNKVTRFTAESTTDEIITISSEEKYLYINLLNYDNETDGVWEVVETPVNEAVKELIENGITDVYKENINNIIEDHAYNFGGSDVGTIYTGGISSASGFACQILPLDDADYIVLYGKGSLYAYRGYMFVDADNKILSKAEGGYDTRGNGVVLQLPTGAKRLYINYDSYNSDTDRADICKSVNLNLDYSQAKYPLLGKNIICFGDSITEFEQYQMGYPDWLSFFSGANVTKVGVGGTQLRQRTTPVSTPTSTDEAYAALDIVNMIKASCEQDFTKQEAAALYLYNNTGDDNREIVTRLAAINWSAVDGIVVFGGTNDWNNASAYWGNEDDNSFDTTFGAINKIIQLVSTTYPKVKIYWMTPIVRWIGYASGTGLDENFSDVLVSGTMTLRQFAQKVYDIVKSNHIPVCDLYNSLGWNKYNFSSYFLDNDGTHPFKGFAELAKNIYNFILRYNTL